MSRSLFGTGGRMSAVIVVVALVVALVDVVMAGPASASRSVGDGVGFFNAANGTWALRNDAKTSGPADYTYGAYGTPGVIPIVGDWNGDGLDGIGYYNPADGTWHLRNNATTGGPSDYVYRGMGGYAAANIVPIAGNWPANGEGYRDGIGYYNPADGTWHLRNDATRPGGSNYSYRGIGGYASTEMVPVAGDWDGNVTDGVGYYIPADGTWHLRVDATRPGGSNFVLQFGAPDGIPVSGDWHGGLGDGVGYYNPADGTWHLRINVRWSGGSNYILNGFGSPTMIPIVGKWSTS